MGLLVGLGLGTGLFCVWWSCWAPPARSTARSRPAWRVRVAEELATAGLPGAEGAVLAGCLLSAATAFAAAFWLSRSVPAAAVLAVIAGCLPVSVLRGRARRQREVWQRAWPDVVDNLTSAVRAGLSLPEALGRLGERGPHALRPAFAAFAHDYAVTARFGDCLDALKERLADPVGDRICEALRITREVGGSDLGTLLRNLSVFLRQDAATRAELEARQSWTGSAARLAGAAPWLVLALLAGRAETAAAYARPEGGAVLVAGAVVSLLAYGLMLRLARLPAEPRVLR